MNWDVIHILGNGPSADGLDTDFFAGKNLLVINRAAVRIPSAGALFSLDRNWINQNTELIKNFKGERYLALALPESVPNEVNKGWIPGVEYFNWWHRDGLSDNPCCVCTGCNSGYAAINVAYHKGTKEIHLYGYDMDPKDNDQYQFWSKAFDTMIPQLNNRGIKVWNHNPKSFITAFEIYSANKSSVRVQHLIQALELS